MPCRTRHATSRGRWPSAGGRAKVIGGKRGRVRERMVVLRGTDRRDPPPRATQREEGPLMNRRQITVAGVLVVALISGTWAVARVQESNDSTYSNLERFVQVLVK